MIERKMVKQKISDRFRNSRYAQAYYCSSGYLRTMAYRGYHHLVSIRVALSWQLNAAGSEWLPRKLLFRWPYNSSPRFLNHGMKTLISRVICS